MNKSLLQKLPGFNRRRLRWLGLVVVLAGTLVSRISIAEASLPVGPSAKVVLLHGLARSSDSMAPLAQRLAEEGFAACNIDYPSRKHSVAELVSRFVFPAIQACFGETAEAIHFVTHSMGGIVVRQLAAADVPLTFGRVVMLAPPNGGSEVVDVLGDWALFGWLNGPAGRQLGTGEDDLPRSLGPAPFEVGIVAGNRSINLLLSSLVEGTDDGKVSVENAKLEGMADFLVVGKTHPFIMRDDAVADQVVHFLRHGVFQQAPVEVDDQR